MCENSLPDAYSAGSGTPDIKMKVLSTEFSGTEYQDNIPEAGKIMYFALLYITVFQAFFPFLQ